MRKLTYENIGRETMQFYEKLTSDESIGRDTMQFLWEINL